MGNMCKHDAHDEKKQSEARIRAKKIYASKIVFHPGPKSKKSALRPPIFFDKILILKMQEVPRSPKISLEVMWTHVQKPRKS